MSVRPPAPDHIPELDGIRGIAIALVLLYHFGYEASQGGPRLFSEALGLGWSGVDLFFVLSGFLITGILLDTKSSTNFFRIFYARRFLRIFPLYFGVLLLFFHGAVPLAHHFQKWTSLDISTEGWYWAYLANWPIGHNHSISVLVPFWSLSVEEQFYILWPLAVFLCSRRQLAYLAIAIGAAACAARWLYTPQPGGILVYVWTAFRMDGLAVGALCAMIVRDEGWRSRCRQWLGPLAMCALAGIVIVCIAGKTTAGDGVLMQRYGFTLLAAFYACVVLRGATGSRSGDWISRALTSKLLVRLGTVSYGVYVLHYMLAHGLGSAMASAENRWPLSPVLRAVLMIVGGTLLSYGAAEISWRFFESRILSWKGRFRYTYRAEQAVSQSSRG